MAFIELNENELAMLSEEEREQYTVRLKLHRERVEFVKKLEQIEKANYQYKKPEFKRINPVRRIDIPKHKKIKKVSISMSFGIDRELNEKLMSQRSANDKTKKRMGIRYIVKGFPAKYKAAPISVPAYTGKKKHDITDVAKTRYKIKAPRFKLNEFNKKKITDLPKSKAPLLAGISFRYSRKPVSVAKTKVELPPKKKYSGHNAVQVRNIPSVFVKSHQIKPYIFNLSDKDAVLDIKTKVRSTEVITPKLLFNYAPKSVSVVNNKVELPKKVDFKFERSAEIRDIPSVEIKNIPKKEYALKLNNEPFISDVKAKASDVIIEAPKLSFKSHRADIKNIPTVRQVGEIDTSLKERILNGEFVKIDSDKFNVRIPQKPDFKAEPLQLKAVSVPALVKCQQPVISKINVDKPKKVQLPKLEIHTPNHSKDHVEEIMNRIMKGIQGA